jgi:hypothetical protein
MLKYMCYFVRILNKSVFLNITLDFPVISDGQFSSN